MLDIAGHLSNKGGFITGWGNVPSLGLFYFEGFPKCLSFGNLKFRIPPKFWNYKIVNSKIQKFIIPKLGSEWKIFHII